jgi:hypothetical protein
MERAFGLISTAIAKKAMLMVAVFAVPFAGQRAATPDHATEIHVQIMDSRTHRPLKGRRVQVTLPPDGQLYNNSPSMVGHTGSDGDATFEVGQHVPPKIYVFLWFSYVCSDTGVYSTRSVLQDGVVASWHLTGNKKADKWCAADSQTPRPEVQPGKIIIFVHPMNRLVWSWYDMFS